MVQEQEKLHLKMRGHQVKPITRIQIRNFRLLQLARRQSVPPFKIWYVPMKISSPEFLLNGSFVLLGNVCHGKCVAGFKEGKAACCGSGTYSGTEELRVEEESMGMNHMNYAVIQVSMFGLMVVILQKRQTTNQQSYYGVDRLVSPILTMSNSSLNVNGCCSSLGFNAIQILNVN